MNKFLEIFEIIIAFGIISFSIISINYGIKTLIIHIKKHKKIMTCCWLTLIQASSQLFYVLIFSYVIIQSAILKNIIIEVTSLGALLIRPVIFITCVTMAITLKTRYITSLNSKKIEEVKNG